MLYHVPNLADFTAEGPHSELIGTHGQVRVALFSLDPGQVVPTHRSPARVFMHVVEGGGHLVVGDERHVVTAGDLAAVEPGQDHGMAAAADRRMLVMALIVQES